MPFIWMVKPKCFPIRTGYMISILSAVHYMEFWSSRNTSLPCKSGRIKSVGKVAIAYTLVMHFLDRSIPLLRVIFVIAKVSDFITVKSNFQYAFPVVVEAQQHVKLYGWKLGKYNTNYICPYHNSGDYSMSYEENEVVVMIVERTKWD